MDGNSPGKRISRHANGRGSSTDVNKEKGSIELEHVLGISVYSSSALTCHPMSGLVAYPAGCVLILLDTVKNKQTATLHTPRKSITAASFSPDGRYVLTGESGLQPAVRVWDISRMTEVATLKGHSVGIASVSFSPRMREIIVVGDAQDMIISVWSWPSKTMKALNKFSDAIYAMDVSEDSSYFVTVGNRHVKFYNLDTIKQFSSHVETHFPVPLPTRCGILDSLKDNCFCDVVCGRGSSSFYIFVISISGMLCQVNRNRLLERWVDVNMSRACCIDADESNVFVGGSQGLIRIFQALSLQIVLTLPRPHSLGLDIAEINHSPSVLCDFDKERHSPRVEHPGARALAFDYVHQNLTVVYDDHSLYIWSKDTKDNLAFGDKKLLFKKRYSSMYHRGCVWDVTTYPVIPEAQTEEGDEGGALPPGALISISSDGTLRAWDVCANICEESMLKRNSLSAECLKIVYTEKVGPLKKENDRIGGRRKAKDAGNTGLAISGFKKMGKQSFSVLSVCPNGIDIAIGNRHGRIYIYDANTMKLKATMFAHEAEVTAMKYSSTHRYKVLASGSRDRMIHVMDACRNYQLLTTLDDHSSTITSINFTHISRCLMLVSSSLDKSILIRAYLDSSRLAFKPVRAIVEKKSIMDFAIHPWSGLLVLACQDRLVRVYSMLSSIEDNTFRGCPKCGGQLIKIQIDPSGQFILTACSNKTVNLIQFCTGQMISTINGHAESITSINFSHNMKHVITSAIDGCIFLWRVPEFVTYAARKEMAEMGRLTRGMVLSDRWKKSRLLECTDPQQSEIERDKYHRDVQKSESTPPIDPENTVNNFVNIQYELNENGTKACFYPRCFNACADKVKQTSEAWLNGCDERRRKFKLEAQSIHKILAMMRLVTDAMEKDLANADWIICPPDSSKVACPPNMINTGSLAYNGEPEAGDGTFKMVISKSLLTDDLFQVPTQKTHNAPTAERPREDKSESGSSVYEKLQRDWYNHLCRQENTSFSNSMLPKPLERMTIKLSTESNRYECVGTFQFFNELEGYNYSSAVNHITQALEKRHKLNSSPDILKSSLLQYQHRHERHLDQGRTVLRHSADDLNKNNIVLKTESTQIHDVGSRIIDTSLSYYRQFEMGASTSLCNMNLAVGRKQIRLLNSEFEAWPCGGRVLKLSESYGNLLQGATCRCHQCRNSIRVHCALQVETGGKRPHSVHYSSSDALEFEELYLRPLTTECEKKTVEPNRSFTSLVLGRGATKSSHLLSETKEAAKGFLREQGMMRQGGKKFAAVAKVTKGPEEKAAINHATSGDSESLKSTKSANLSIGSGQNVISRLGEGDVGSSIELSKFLAMTDSSCINSAASIQTAPTIHVP